MKTICITIDFEKQSSCSITMTQLEEIGDVSWVGGLKFDYGGDIGQEVWMVECFIDNNEIGFNLDREYNFKDEYEYFLQYFRRKKIATKEELRLAPLWCSSFVRVLSNRILKFAEVRGGVKHCSINSIVDERNIGTAGYLGVKFGCIFGTKVFKGAAYENDAYALDRLHLGPYAAEIDPLNISIGKDLKHFNSDLVKNHNKFSIKRIAITLLDAGSQFVFANANTTGFITNCAEQMEKSLTAQRAESFTSFLVKERISSPISLNYSPQEESSFFIRYLDESIGVHNALDESLQISSNNNTLPSLASASKGLRLGLAENFRFIKKAIEEGEDETANARLYFYPINHGASLYFFPAFILFLIVGSQLADSDRKIESNFLPIVRADFSEALTIEAIALLRRAKQFACKSAIGSIMSRNGSHNIGSHVLAALSHNVGTMPDDRVLYQYIQHRMDYIATATTERPQWRQPTMIVSSLMKEFLMQRHLLDHISGSDGLHAYKFQGQSIDDNDKNTIRMHIRRVRDCAKDHWEENGFLLEGKKNESGNVVDFIDYDKSEIINPDKDVAIAVPGGIVGNHAFYTIIENVLRNAAKHEWAEAMRVWKMACELLGEAECLDTYKECQPKNLDVYVDFFDESKEGKVQCRIWNDCVVSVDDTAKIKAAILRKLIRNCDERKADGAMWEERLLSATKTLTQLYSILKKSDSVNDNELYKLINCMSDETAKKEAILSEDEKEKFDKDMEWRKAIVLGLRSREEGGEYKIEDVVIRNFLKVGIATSTAELQKRLEDKIKLSFIDESTGNLRKENWGIAEMRISAGYLQCRGTGHIGGLPGTGKSLEIIRPVLVKNDDNDKCVAYRFDIDKPKLLLVVLKVWQDVSMLRKNSMRFGVDFICREDLKSDVAYPYSYILFEHLDNELKAQLTSREIMLPYRQMYASIDGDGNGLEEYLPNYIGTFFKSLEDKFTELRESGESAAKVCYVLIEEVYATWMLHVQKRGFLPRAADASPKDVILDIGDDSSSGSGQTLVSQYELLRFVFENSFNAAIRSFLKENRPDGGTGSLKVKNQKGSLERMIVSLPSKIAAVLSAVSQMRVRRIDDEFGKRVTEGWTVPEIVNKQLNLWMEEVIGDDKKVCINLKETDQRWARQFKKEFSLGSAWSAAIEVGSVADLNDSECDYWLGRFEDYISSTILDQAETFLSKYEERYVTLPRMLELQSSNVVHPDEKHCQEFLWNKQKLTIIVSDSKERSEKRSVAIVNQDICYFRHGTAKQKTIGDNYYEPLSGSQSTFNVFRSVYRDLLHSEDSATHCKIAGFYTRLVENAATRILIVDERVAKFVRDHSEVGDILGGLRIAVADDTDINVMRMFSSEQIDDTLEFSKVELKKFEIVIIHQGIIDKLLHGHEDKYRVRDWLDKLVEKLHYVVITTGRGLPSNIPDTARVLPYSVIENSILQRFPEKMLLVDAIMNILPVRKGEK